MREIRIPSNNVIEKPWHNFIFPTPFNFVNQFQALLALIEQFNCYIDIYLTNSILAEINGELRFP